MIFYVYCLCALCLVIELKALEVYVISPNDERHLKLMPDNKNLFNNIPIDELRSEYESKELKPKCKGQFGINFGSETQKIICFERHHEDRYQPLEKIYYKRKRKHRNPEVVKPFEDLTRVFNPSAFSTDYVDINDFARRRDSTEFSKDYLDVGDLSRHDYIEEPRRSPFEIKQNKKPKTAKYKADSGTDSSLEEESEEKSSHRFQVVDNESSDFDKVSEEEEERSIEVSIENSKEDSSEEVEPKEPEPKEPKYVYLQGRNRYVKDVDGRKRLQHFMPKRFHWKEDEVKNLGYYWFNGPRGRYADFVNAFEK